MYDLSSIIVFVTLTCFMSYSLASYVVPVCSENGGICAEKMIHIIPEYCTGWWEDSILQKGTGYCMTFAFIVFDCIEAVFSSVADLVNELCDEIWFFFNGRPPPPPSYLDNLLAWIAYSPEIKEETPTSFFALFQPGFAMYLSLICFAFYMFILSFHTKQPDDSSASEKPSETGSNAECDSKTSSDYYESPHYRNFYRYDEVSGCDKCPCCSCLRSIHNDLLS